MNGDGKMDINEFSVACKLINLRLKGMELPKSLPPQLLNSGAAMGGMGGMAHPNTLPLHGGMRPMQPGMPGITISLVKEVTFMDTAEILNASESE